MDHGTVSRREGDVCLWTWTLDWLWFCVLLVPTLFISLLFVAGPALVQYHCRFTLGDAVGVVLFCGSFGVAILMGFRTSNFLGRLMSRSSALRRVWVWVLGLGASLVGSVLAASVLVGLWTGVFWITSRVSFFHTGCQAEPFP